LRPWLWLQIGLTGFGLVALAFYPPPSGAMALIALDGRDAGELAAQAIADGGKLLGRGPTRNILLVVGARDRIAAGSPANGILVIAAPQSWCGQPIRLT
jgi:hypothetical protein